MLSFTHLHAPKESCYYNTALDKRLVLLKYCLESSVTERKTLFVEKKSVLQIEVVIQLLVCLLSGDPAKKQSFLQVFPSTFRECD